MVVMFRLLKLLSSQVQHSQGYEGEGTGNYSVYVKISGKGGLELQQSSGHVEIVVDSASYAYLVLPWGSYELRGKNVPEIINIRCPAAHLDTITVAMPDQTALNISGYGHVKVWQEADELYIEASSE